MIKDAEFSPCRRYRYRLVRIWDETKPVINWVAFNPSTADENKDDRTIGREIRFSETWGYGGLIKTNLFAFVTPHPEELRRVHDPVGPENDRYIYETAAHAERVLVAWGGDGWGKFRGRASWVYHKYLRDFPCYCLAVNLDGNPKHPLYVKGDVQPRPFTWRA